jgi:hypothetical protein
VTKGGGFQPPPFLFYTPAVNWSLGSLCAAALLGGLLLFASPDPGAAGASVDAIASADAAAPAILTAFVRKSPHVSATTVRPIRLTASQAIADACVCAPRPAISHVPTRLPLRI